MASGNTNYNTNYNTAGNMTSSQTAPIGTTSNFGHTLGGTTTHGNVDTTSTLGHTYGSTGSTLGHTTAPLHSSTSTLGHTTGHTTTGLKEGEHPTKGTGMKDEFVGGMKEAAGTVFCSQKLKAAGHEQKVLGKEEIATAKAEKGVIGEKGTVGTAAGAKAFDETDKERSKFDKKAEKDQLKADKKAAKERAKAEKLAEKEHGKTEFSGKEHKLGKGHKLDKDHTTETIKEPAHTEPFVGRVDRLNANHGNPHIEPHVAAMMTHGMPIESRTVIEQPIVTSVAVEKPVTIVEKPLTTFEKTTIEKPLTTSYDKPLVSGAYEQRDFEKGVFEKPLTGGITRETHIEEVIKPNHTQGMPSTQRFAADNFDNKFGSDRLNTKFDNMNLNQGNRLNVSPRADRLNVSPRNLNVSPRHCDAGRLETSPRHMAHV